MDSCVSKILRRREKRRDSYISSTLLPLSFILTRVVNVMKLWPLMPTSIWIVYIRILSLYLSCKILLWTAHNTFAKLCPYYKWKSRSKLCMKTIYKTSKMTYIFGGGNLFPLSCLYMYILVRSYSFEMCCIIMWILLLHRIFVIDLFQICPSKNMCVYICFGHVFSFQWRSDFYLFDPTNKKNAEWLVH